MPVKFPFGKTEQNDKSCSLKATTGQRDGSCGQTEPEQEFLELTYSIYVFIPEVNC